MRVLLPVAALLLSVAFLLTGNGLQGVLAPLQFLVFLISLGLVLRFLATGEGLAAATISIVVKTLLLYTIMITGSIWEKVVFGKWLGKMALALVQIAIAMAMSTATRHRT